MTSQRNVVLFDSDQFWGRELSVVMAKMNCEVICYSSIFEMLASLDESLVDVAIIDLHQSAVKEDDIISFSSIINKSRNLVGIVLVPKGYNNPLLNEDPFISTVEKPLKFATLSIVLEEALGKSHLRKELASSEDKLREKDELFNHVQKLKTLGELAGGIAHDFNNLLAVINSCATLLRMELGEELGMKVERTLGVLDNCSEQGKKLTGKLLKFSRKESSATVTFEVNALLEELEEFLKHTIKENITIDFNLCDEKAVISGNPDQIRQSFMNLVINARDAMKSGGRLTVASKVESSSRCDGSTVRISIKDTGAGMTEEVRQRIFDPFFTTKEAGKGTGLGLSLVSSTVKDHGGVLNVYSELNVGSEFEIVLPLSDEPLKKQNVKSNDSLVAGCGHILVVDDEPLLRTTTVDMLEALGYEVQSAASGEEALEVFQSFEGYFDVIVLDMVMPGMTGIECYREMVRLKGKVNAVFTSGHSGEELEKSLVDDDNVAFIRKPFNMGEFSKVLNSLVQVQEALNGAS